MTSKKYKSERQKRGTQQQVARMLGVDRVTVAKRESGMRPITKEAWIAIRSLPAIQKSKNIFC